MSWEDQPLPEDAEIDAAFPARSGSHETYAEAMRLVGARHSKRGLVELVNWLLFRIAALEVALTECRGEPFAADPAKWPHKDQIEGLGLQLIDERAKVKP